MAVEYVPFFYPSTVEYGYTDLENLQWVIGGVGDDDSFNRSVVQGCHAVVVDVGYRLAPEHRFPTPVIDSWEAYTWLAENAANMGIDPNKMAVGGFSAGGHIAAVISQLARDTEFLYKPCFQLLVIPVTDATALGLDLEVASGRLLNSPEF